MTWKRWFQNFSPAPLSLWVWFWTSQILEIPNYITYLFIWECIVLEIKVVFKNVPFSPLFSQGEPGAEREFSAGQGQGWDACPGLPLCGHSGGEPRPQDWGRPLVITIVMNQIFKSSIFSLGFTHECSKVMSYISIIVILMWFLTSFCRWCAQGPIHTYGILPQGKTNLSLQSSLHNSPTSFKEIHFRARWTAFLISPFLMEHLPMGNHTE